METDALLPQVAIETRDPGERIALFSVMNYATGTTVSRNLDVDNPWWWGVDKLHGDRLYLFGYPTGNVPGRKGILAIDLLTEKTAWYYPHLALEAICDEGVWVYDTSFLPKKSWLVSHQTGERISPSSFQSSLVPEVVFPQALGPSALLPTYLPPTSGEVFFSDLNGKQCWCFHTPVGESFDQCLLIAQNNEVVGVDYLDRGIQKLNPEAFFSQHQHLLSIRGRSEIVSYLV